MAQTWQDRAACIDAPPGMAHNPDEAPEFVDTYCRGCPVIDECGTAGRRGREFGVWGGEFLLFATGRTAAEQRRDRRRIVLPESNSIRHGTRAMYVKGCGCPPCREAERVYSLERRARRREEATA